MLKFRIDAIKREAKTGRVVQQWITLTPVAGSKNDVVLGDSFDIPYFKLDYLEVDPKLGNLLVLATPFELTDENGELENS